MRWTVRYDRRKERIQKLGQREEKWASFTRWRLIPKAGRGMVGWVGRQQVRQTHTYMKEETKHTL